MVSALEFVATITVVAVLIVLPKLKTILLEFKDKKDESDS